jgi:hypothetical protein
MFASDEKTEGNTVAGMLRGDVADASVFWNIGSWSDETWYFTNLANGTNHLIKKPNGLTVMTPDISAPAAPGQRWYLKKITAINDKDYSSVNVRSICGRGDDRYGDYGSKRAHFVSHGYLHTH